MSRDLFRLTARDAVDLLRRRETTPRELIDEAERRMTEVEPSLNAVPIRCFERARDHARRIAQGAVEAGVLLGLPIIVKDLTAVGGVRWTEGSQVFADRVASRSDILVERLEANGAIIIGKSNTPEFGAGGTTVNDVFGHTRNPWDISLTSGGSSGGSAAAIASGEAWLATGSDMAGSVRLPASFCSVVGLRPSPGRVPHGPRPLSFGTLDVDGPIARNVADAALMLDAMAGEHSDDPLSIPAPAGSFLRAALQPRAPLRVVWSPDLGISPVHPEVRATCERALAKFSMIAVETGCPDFSQAEQTFQVLRNMQRVGGTMELLDRYRDKLSPEIIHYSTRGLNHTAREIAVAELARGELYRRMAALFETCDLLITPTVMVPPFDYRQRHVMEVEGVRLPDFFAWLRLTLAITLTSCPAISIPCGFTADGLPVGMQLVGKPRGEAALLSHAAFFEADLPFAGLLPIDPRASALPNASIIAAGTRRAT
jgi:amidase